MIKISYEYNCDVCGAQVRSSERCELRVGQTAPVPDPCGRLRLGGALLCETCYRVACEAVSERYTAMQKPA